MKYLYKGMGLPGWGDISGSVLLGWHEKVRRMSIFHLSNVMLTTTTLSHPSLFFLQLTEVAGVGCIVRAMTDRRIV